MRGIHTARVVIVDDHTLFGESLKAVLAAEGYDARLAPMQPGGHSQSALLSTVVRMEPSVVLLDLDLGAFGNGIRMVQPLVRSGAAVIVVTASADRPRWGEALRYGARRVLCKSAPLEEILATVRKVKDGRMVIARQERDELLAEWHRECVWSSDICRRLERLTHREAEVLAHLVEGRQVSEIAQGSVVSVATVRTQVKSILAKLEVTSQLAAVGLAHQVHWQPPVAAHIPAQRSPAAAS